MYKIFLGITGLLFGLNSFGLERTCGASTLSYRVYDNEASSSITSPSLSISCNGINHIFIIGYYHESAEKDVKYMLLQSYLNLSQKAKELNKTVYIEYTSSGAINYISGMRIQQ